MMGFKAFSNALTADALLVKYSKRIGEPPLRSKVMPTPLGPKSDETVSGDVQR
jgi:hypothetical protein